MLSPLEELAGFNYGFIYLLEIQGAVEIGRPMGLAHGGRAALAERLLHNGGPQCVYKLGYSEHPMRRIRELQPAYKGRLKLRACFVGDPPAERFAHRRFKSLRVKNELFLAHPIIDEYFRSSREQMRSKLRDIHVCSPACPQLNARLDLAMLSAWLAR
ncbi:MAG TPA: GIY-YIG nuclease family protein [Candidatus Rubrimentiphilum sp.]|nr:GIY-YIG nuclease family protein [Candidatus Rubrimentiphilum sp.]